MTETELVSIIDAEIANSVGYYSGKLADDRNKAMEYYYGEPFGNEMEGRSQYISQDVADTIEWIMPALMKIFMSTDEVARFDPVGIEDEPGARQVTDWCQHVFTRQNPGFVILYSFFKDALLLKNGFVKVYWEDYKTRKVEEYSNLEPDELIALVMKLEQEGAQVEVEQDMEGTSRLTIASAYGKICIDPVPPDEILVTKNATWDLQKARCVTHRTRKTASQLTEMGYDIPEASGDDAAEFGMERQTRYLHEQEDVLDDENNDPASRIYWVDESYILVDYNGDGIAERRQICKVGRKILSGKDGPANVEIGRVPIETTTPILMPHKLYGRSVAELIMDLQFLKSEITRQIIDNLRLTNNPRKQVLDGMVNIDDILTVRPGGIVRVKTFDAVKDMVVPFMGAPAFNMLGYVDQVREGRTGTRYFQGIDPNALAKDTSGVAMANFVNASMERIELVARIFAETGVKGIFTAIYELSQKHIKKAQVVRLRGEWVNIDPRDWAQRYDLTVTVGLGTGSKEQFLRGAQVIGQIQAEIAKNGLTNIVTPQNIYHFARDTAEAIAPKKSDLYFTNPKGQAPPKQPDPKVEMQKEKALMADKTKRDMGAVTFLTEIAKLASQPKGEPQEDPNEERSYQLGMKRMEQDHEARMASDARKPQEDQTEIMKMDAQKTEQVMQMVSQLAQMQQQQAQMLGQMLKVMSAPKKLITDAKGEPIGVEPQMAEEE